MKAIKLSLFFILICLFFFAGCTNHYHDLYFDINSRKLSDSTITFFSFHPQDNPGLNSEIEARINNKTSQITLITPVGSNITANKLKSRFASEGLVYVNGKIQTSGSDEHLYNNPDAPVTYEVVSANEKSRKRYTVRVLEHSPLIFVNPAASGSRDGSTWGNAFNNLQEAIDLAECFPESRQKEIWIAAGTYRPSTTNNIEDYFILSANTSYIGGFAGNETDKSQRNIQANRTIISGSLSGGQYSYNLFGSFDGDIVHVITKDVYFDGIEFVSAKASLATDIRKLGAAINVLFDPEAVLKIVNCTFNDLEGGAIFALNGGIVFSDTVFSNITAAENFGAVYINGENTEITGAVFKDIKGSALSISSTKITINNAEFKNITGTGANNQALYITADNASVKNVNIDGVKNGRGIYAVSYNNLLISESQIMNCAITGHGGGLYLNNYGQAEISFTDFIYTTAVIGSGIFYIGNKDEKKSSLLLIDIQYDYAPVNSASHPQMHFIGENITVR